MSDVVLLQRHDGWAELVLNRPERRNAIDGPLAEGLVAHLKALKNDDSVRALVLRGAGGCWSSGLDLTVFKGEPAPPWRANFFSTWAALHQALLEAPQALVLALERHAINGSASVAMASDLMVVGQGAFLQVAEVQLGMAAPMNMAWLAMRHGGALAARLTLLGERWDADTLLRQGIATEVVPDDQVVARACALATRIAGYPPPGPKLIRAGLRDAYRHALHNFGRPL